MLPNPLLDFLFCFDSSFLKRTSSPLGPSPAYLYPTKKKRNCIGLQSIFTRVRIIKSSDVVFAAVLKLKYRGSLFIFTIQTEKTLLKFNRNTWNDRSFRSAKLFWQSLVQQNRGILTYFSLNVNTNTLVLVVVMPNSSHVTPARELAAFDYWRYCSEVFQHLIRQLPLAAFLFESRLGWKARFRFM